MDDAGSEQLVATTPIAWTDALLVGHALLDHLHRDFVGALTATQTCADADVMANLRALAGSAKRQFDQEDRWMHESGFPPRDCHAEEHAAVMASFALVADQVETGDVAEGKRLAAALADWFPRHVAHLDSALAHWLFKQHSAGTPVVLRRGAAVGS